MAKKLNTIKKRRVINYGLTLVNEEELIDLKSENAKKLKAKEVILSFEYFHSHHFDAGVAYI